ncbi:MAG: hypothetical protein SFV23_07605 [Planctomycetaceae bacterium]|nr:hypothetical protein [Planctomycetaceae bacterium]
MNVKTIRTLLVILIGLPLGMSDKLSAQEPAPAAKVAPEVPAAVIAEPTEDEYIRERLEQALLRYRNLAADARETEREWLRGTADLIRRIEERLPKATTVSAPTATVPDTSGGVAAQAPSATAVQKPAARKSTDLNDDNSLCPPAVTPPVLAVKARSLAAGGRPAQARRLEALAAELLLLATELRTEASPNSSETSEK